MYKKFPSWKLVCIVIITTSSPSTSTHAHIVSRFVDESHPDSSKIQDKSSELDRTFQRLSTLAETRHSKLQVSGWIISAPLIIIATNKQGNLLLIITTMYTYVKGAIFWERWSIF